MRALLSLGLVVASLFATAAPAHAGDTPVVDLLSDSEAHDGEIIGEISIRGELVGDYQRRGRAVWVQLNDDAYVDAPLRDGGDPGGANVGIALRIPSELFEDLDVEQVGGYRWRGPVVRVEGFWRHHDEDRQGESYFEVTSIVLLDPARRMDDPVEWWAVILGGFLIAAVAIPLLRRR